MNGLFADHGVDVEILDPSGGPDNVVRVGMGESDFALTSVQHYLSARAVHGDMPARFVAMVVQRSPIGALVPADSALRRPADLASCRVGGDPVVADGCDTRTDFDTLLALGCSEAQGRFIAGPMPAADMVGWALAGYVPAEAGSSR